MLLLILQHGTLTAKTTKNNNDPINFTVNTLYTDKTMQTTIYNIKISHVLEV